MVMQRLNKNKGIIMKKFIYASETLVPHLKFLQRMTIEKEFHY